MTKVQQQLSEINVLPLLILLASLVGTGGAQATEGCCEADQLEEGDECARWYLLPLLEQELLDELLCEDVEKERAEEEELSS